MLLFLSLEGVPVEARVVGLASFVFGWVCVQHGWFSLIFPVIFGRSVFVLGPVVPPWSSMVEFGS